MHFISPIVFAVSVSGFADIVRHNGPGCSVPQAECPHATQGNCCRAPLPGMFPMRAKGVTIALDQTSNLAVSVPYQRGNGIYCGSPITSEATFGSIGCYQNSLLGSGLYIECNPTSAKFATPPNATTVIEKRDPRCPNERRDELSSDVNVASKFRDEYGNDTDEQGYIDAIQRVEDGIAQMGETKYYLNKQTGIAPENMVFEEEQFDERAASIADAYAGIHHCSGERLVSVTAINKCYTAGNGASILLHEEIPARCVLNTWAATPDCTGDSTAVAVQGSQLGCLSGTNFDSIRLDCTQKLEE